MACCQKHAAAEDSYDTLRRRGGDNPKRQHPSPVATSSPSGGRGRCSAVVGEGVGGAMASKCLLLMTSSWPTTGVGKILGLTKDSKKESAKNDQGLKTRTLQKSTALYLAHRSKLVSEIDDLGDYEDFVKSALFKTT